MYLINRKVSYSRLVPTLMNVESSQAATVQTGTALKKRADLI